MKTMDEKQFKNLASESINLTQKGIALMIEVNELSSAAVNIRQDEDFRKLIEEITSKQKRAVEYIQNAMLIEKNLLQKQAEKITVIVNKLS
jgi:hypothetical protein